MIQQSAWYLYIHTYVYVGMIRENCKASFEMDPVEEENKVRSSESPKQLLGGCQSEFDNSAVLGDLVLFVIFLNDKSL